MARAVTKPRTEDSVLIWLTTPTLVSKVSAISTSRMDVSMVPG